VKLLHGNNLGYVTNDWGTMSGHARGRTATGFVVKRYSGDDSGSGRNGTTGGDVRFSGAEDARRSITTGRVEKTSGQSGVRAVVGKSYLMCQKIVVGV